MALLLFLLVAINHAGARYFVQAAIPQHKLCAYPSSFVSPKSINTASILTQTSFFGRRRVISRSSLSQNVREEKEDVSFFLQASKDAAQQRMKQLKEGQDPLAVSLSSPLSGDATDGVLTGDATDGGLIEEDREETEGDEPIISVDEEIPVDPLSFGKAEVKTSAYSEMLGSLPPIEGSASQDPEKAHISNISEGGEASTPDGEEQQSLVAEGQTAENSEETQHPAHHDTADDEASKTMEQTASLALEGGGNQSELKEKEGDEKELQQSQSATAQEVKIPIDPNEARRRQGEIDGEPQAEEDTPASKTDSGNTTTPLKSETTADIEKEKKTATKSESQPPATNSQILSSDGKEIFEPSPSSLELNQEKVDMGLLVLTQSLFTLKSILDKDES